MSASGTFPIRQPSGLHVALGDAEKGVVVYRAWLWLKMLTSLPLEENIFIPVLTGSTQLGEFVATGFLVTQHKVLTIYLCTTTQRIRSFVIIKRLGSSGGRRWNVLGSGSTSVSGAV